MNRQFHQDSLSATFHQKFSCHPEERLAMAALRAAMVATKDLNLPQARHSEQSEESLFGFSTF
jgi:hypothetical protein